MGSDIARFSGRHEVEFRRPVVREAPWRDGVKNLG